MRVIANLHRNTMSSVTLLMRGCKVMYTDHSKIIMVTKGRMKLTFKLKSDNLYHMKVNGSQEDNAEGGMIDMRALHKLLETYMQMTQKHGTVSLGRVRLGWLRIEEKQSKRARTDPKRVLGQCAETV